MAGCYLSSGRSSSSFLGVFIILVVMKACTATDLDIKGTGKAADIVKRQLRWNSNGYIVSDKNTNLDMKIDYLKPHTKNDEVEYNRNYMAFTLYMRNGHVEEENTGIFHFVNSNEAGNLRVKCSRPSMHAGAYYYFYKTCPENEINLVASGYCYQGANGRGLVFHSITFNNGNMSYVDKQYYLDQSRDVASYEQSLITSCFNSWKDSDFNVTSFRCKTSEIPVPSGLTSQSEKSRYKRSSGTCSQCDCTDVNGSQGFSHLNYVVFVLTLWTMSYFCF